MVLTVFIDSKDRGAAHRQLSESLSRGRRDVVPTFSCRGTNVVYIYTRSQTKKTFVYFNCRMLILVDYLNLADVRHDTTNC